MYHRILAERSFKHYPELKNRQLTCVEAEFFRAVTFLDASKIVIDLPTNWVHSSFLVSIKRKAFQLA